MFKMYSNIEILPSIQNSCIALQLNCSATSSIIYFHCSQDAHPPFLNITYAWLSIEAYEIVGDIGMRANHIVQLAIMIPLQCSKSSCPYFISMLHFSVYKQQHTYKLRV